jgi:hypothetical protein
MTHQSDSNYLLVKVVDCFEVVDRLECSSLTVWLVFLSRRLHLPLLAFNVKKLPGHGHDGAEGTTILEARPEFPTSVTLLFS